MFLKATIRPQSRPEEPNPDDKKELPNENTWVYDEYNKLRDCIDKIIEPLDDYIKTYDRFQSEYDFNPDAEMAKYADPEDWPDVDTLRAAITFHQSEDKRL
jgi:hypothetical protein